jgi:hypothetical protein
VLFVLEFSKEEFTKWEHFLIYAFLALIKSIKRIFTTSDS